MWRAIWSDDLRMRGGSRWWMDGQFALALVAALPFWGWLAWRGAPSAVLPPLVLVSVVLVQPVVEELLFRGALQGRLLATAWGRQRLAGLLTRANLLVSLLFAALHLWQHPPLWAAGVLLPSLLFGHFRERHDSTVPAIVLHVYYNAGYFLRPG